MTGSERGGEVRVRWEEGVRGHLGRVGGDGAGRGMRKGHRTGRNQKCIGIISLGWEREKCMGKGDGASAPVMCSMCAVKTCMVGSGN